MNIVNDDTKDVSLAIVASQIEFLREDVRELTKQVNTSNENKVSHREWSQRNDHVNTRLGGLGREIGDLRTEIRAKSAPWWSVGALVVSVIAVGWNVINP